MKISEVLQRLVKSLAQFIIIDYIIVMRRKALTSNGRGVSHTPSLTSNRRGEVISPNVKCKRARKPCPYIAIFAILFLVLAALFCGCYSGSYGDPIDPCDPDVPVILNGDTIPENRITRNDSGCVIAIEISGMDISDSNCIEGIETWSVTLEWLNLLHNPLTNINLTPLSSCTNLKKLCLDWNNITTIDLAPLSSCTNLKQFSIDYNALTTIDLTPLSSCLNLEWLYLYSNALTSIDLTPLWDLESLEYLELNHNPLDSASCVQVCNFIDEHLCVVCTNCDCP